MTARGAMAISAQATSYLGPSQNAAEEAAREASTGNVALGNTSLENSTVLTRQFAQATVAPTFAYGAAQTRTISDSGSSTTSFPEAAYDQVPNSSYPFTPTLGAEFSSRLSTMASEARSNSETYANVATQSTASAVSKFRELRQQLSSAHGSETAQGSSSSDSIQTAYSEVDQASASLQRQFGLSRRADVSDKLALPSSQLVERPKPVTSHQAHHRHEQPAAAPANLPSLHDEVRRAHEAGQRRIDAQRSTLDEVTRDAKGASAKAADDVKKW